jgi:uncharacterized protein (DUF58 family)
MAITGRVPLLLLLGLAAVPLRPQGTTVLLWLVVVGAVVGADLLLAVSPRSLTVERRAPGRVRVGHEAASEVTVGNPGNRRASLLVRDSWQPSAGIRDNRHRLRLGGGDRVVLSSMVQPVRRGELTSYGVTVRSYGPLGIAARQRTSLVSTTLRALPPFESRKHLPSRLARLRDLDGRSAVRVRGQGTEFDSLREYVRGDDVRSIDWRASARNRSVVVRTWQPERDRRVVLVLDTSRVSAGRVDDVPRLDSAMEAALLLTALAARAGDRVDVVSGDRRVRSRLRLAGARDATSRLEDAFSGLTPEIAEADWTALAGAVQSFGRQRALVCLLTPLEPSAVEEGLLPVLPVLVAHHRVVLASVRDPELERMAGLRAGLDDVYAAAAAEQSLTRRRATADLLETLGVHVLDVPADDLPPALADHYLALKAQGLL